MGWGDFGSNGSVHWSIGYEGSRPKGTPDHIDYDDEVRHPDAPDDGRPPIGKSGERQHEGYFKVTLRFQTESRAIEALGKEALSKLNSRGGDVEIYVPVRSWEQVKDNPGPAETWEIKVEW